MPKALGIPFAIVGAAEKNPQYQKIIEANNTSSLRHLWGTLESMMDSQRHCGGQGGRPGQPGSCLRHPGESCAIPSSISLGVTGSPCNPYSRQRNKRFRDGDVASHSMHQTTVRDVIDFYKQYKPHAGITEQVQGFNMATSSSDKETPMQKPFGQE